MPDLIVGSIDSATLYIFPWSLVHAIALGYPPSPR